MQPNGAYGDWTARRLLLTPRVFDTLLYMVEHHDSVLDKERIMEAVWPDSIVEEKTLLKRSRSCGSYSAKRQVPTATS